MTNEKKSPSTQERGLTLDFDNPTLVREASGASTSILSARDAMTPQEGAGRIASRYEIVGLLGSGGMGNVYKVRDHELDEVVALKTLHASLNQDEQALKRFRREVKLARRVTHPNIARTYDLGTDSETLYLTMEFVAGDTLHNYIASTKRKKSTIPIMRLLDISIDIALGLEAAHAAGVIHRDLKPANVMITCDKRAVITDFGIARVSSAKEAITALDGMVGTPLYMSPEQVEGKSGIDHRTDMYALGVMMFEMLTGRPPFQGDSPVALALARVLNDAPSLAREGFPRDISTVIETLLQRSPEDRYPHAQALILALKHIKLSLSQEQPSAPPLHHTPHTLDSPLRSPPDTSSANSNHKTVAVFPLVRHAQAGEGYIADGFAEELVGELSMSSNLRVRPLSAVKTLLTEADDQDPLRMGKRLNVDVVITGSIREHKGQLRIRLSLISVREGFQIWGGKFISSPSELFMTAEDASEAIAEALTSQVEEDHRPEALTDPVAVDAYMKGRYLLQLNWFEGVSEALSMFQTAMARVPHDPRILTGMATTMARQVFFEPTQAHMLLTQAKQYAQRAIDIAPKWPEPHYAMAMIGYAAGDFSSAIVHSQHALDLSPDHIEAHDLLGRVLAEVGPLNEARYHLEQALKLNETLYRAWWDLIRVYALLDEWELVDAKLTEARDLPVNHNANEAFLYRLHCWRGQDVQTFETNFVASDTDPRFQIIFDTTDELIKKGRLSEDYLHNLQSMARHIPSGSQHIRIFLQLSAEFALISGHYEIAYRAIESALNEGLRDLMWLQHVPFLDPIRGEERFQRLLARAHATLSPVRATLTPHGHRRSK